MFSQEKKVILFALIASTLSLMGCGGGTETVVQTVTVEKIVKVEVPAPLPTPVLTFQFFAPNPVRVVIPGQTNALVAMMTVSGGNKDQCYGLIGFVIGNSDLAKYVTTVRFLEIETPGITRSYLPEMMLEQRGAFTELRMPSYYPSLCVPGNHTYEVRADIKPDTPANTPVTIRGGEV